MSIRDQRIASAESHLATAAGFLGGDIPAAQRNWAGFFAALIAAAKELLPLVLPLFTERKDS